MRVITSFSQDGYEQYGKAFLESYTDYCDQPITVYYEDEQPDFKHDLVSYKNLFEVTGCKETLGILSTFPVFSGNFNGKRNYRYDAFKFIRKCFAQCDAASEEDDLLIWLDSDVIIERDMITAFLAADVDGENFMYYLGRPGWHSCASFVAWDMKHEASDVFWQTYYDVITTGKFLTLEEWHDCMILDTLRGAMHIPAKDLAADIKLGNGPVNVFDKAFAGYARHLKGNLKRGPQRYQQLIDLIIEHEPESIIEVGTWNGHRAVEMIQQVPTAKYYGFDLFEDANDETDKEEKNVKPHNKADDVAQLLQVNKVDAELYAGNTKETLPIFLERHGEDSVDFAFIDGGHSVDTIRSDWEHIKKAIKPGGIVVFDDWYEDLPGQQDDLGKWGCNRVLIEDQLDFELLPIADPVHGGGVTKMAVVRC